jgi:uncharacterized membrane protein
VRRAHGRKKLIFFVIFAALTLLVTYMKNARILDPSSPIAQHFAPAKWFLVVHAFAGALAMALGALQFSNRLRARYLQVHRILGYIYVGSVFISAPFAIPVAMKVASLSLVAASAVQSFGWMLTTGIALYCIRSGNVRQHRRWMMRSYPFAMVFTVARVIIPIPPILRMGFTGIEMVVWSTIALAALLPNIFIEWPEMTAGRKAKAAAV